MITADTLRRAVLRAADGAAKAHDELNTADGKLGDGDTGVMLRRLFQTLAAVPATDEVDLGATFQAYAKACASGTGSSLGTLVTVAMMTMAKATKGRTELDWAELGALLAAVRDAMMARGGAKLGDKTVVDMLDAVATAIAGQSSAASVASAASMAARDTLTLFRDRPNRLGRARMFGDRTIGLDDPGMLAFNHLLQAVIA